MKALQCDLCEFVAQGETFDDWVQALAPHYIEVHADLHNRQLQLDKTDPKLSLEQRIAWADRNRARFDAADLI